MDRRLHVFGILDTHRRLAKQDDVIDWRDYWDTSGTKSLQDAPEITPLSFMRCIQSS